MTIRITGNTFPYKEEFKDFGGAWNGDLKAWEFRDGANVDRWRGKPGLYVTGENPSPEPKPERREPKPRKSDEDIAEFFQNLVRDRERVAQGDGEPSIHGNDITFLNAFQQKNPTMFAGFKSFPDLIDFVAGMPEYTGERGPAWKVGGDWAGTSSMPAALDLARDGWRHGTSLTMKAGDVITSTHALQRVRKYAVAGGRVNVGRMLSGNPLHMVRRPRQEGRKVISLFVQVWMSSAITAENAIIRAACVAAMTDILDGNGYSTEIVAVGTSKFHSGKPGAQVATVIKQAGETLNIENVAFALGHPSMLRRFMFAVCAAEPRLQSFWSYMGSQVHAFEPDALPPGSYYVPKLLMEDQNRVTGDTFADRVRSMFPLIVPQGLPISLT